MFHLNWPVMDSDLWSLHAVFVSLFLYLLICLFCFNYIGFIEALSYSNLGLILLPVWGELWEHCPLFHVCRPYWKPFVAPGNKQIYFLLARLHFVSFSLYLMYLPYWIQLLPIATRIPFPVKLWASSVWSNIGIYNLYIYTDYSCCPWQQVLRSIHKSNSDA